MIASAIWSGHNYVGQDQFGLRETFRQVASETLSPGIYIHAPFFGLQYTHSYQSYVQRINFNAGSCLYLTACPSTADQNALSSLVALNYRVTHDTTKLAQHRWEMDGWMLPDGFWLLRQMMNDSANAIMGRRSMAQTMLNPDLYLKEFYADLSQRLDQNNVPVKIESIELQEFGTFWPVRSVGYARQPAVVRAP